MKNLFKKWWFWLTVIVVVALGAWWGVNYYHTRISPSTSQSGRSDCPNDKPIKGNSQSGIYHVPGGQYYNKTMPERCFENESGAIKAGFRRISK